RFARADVNVIAATNRDLEACAREQRFRQDLFFRLNILQVQLPALRHRRGDIPLLARHFLHEALAAAGGGARFFSPAAMRLLTQHDWPGNVRELQNVVRRAAVDCEAPQIRPFDLSLLAPSGDADAAPTEFRAARAAVVASFERRYVEEL